jgi:hypothetical protein
MSGFECRDVTLPTIVAVLLDSSVILLRELYAERGYGPWIDELHARLQMSVKNQEFAGIRPDEEREQVEAGLTALDALFSVVR